MSFSRSFKCTAAAFLHFAFFSLEPKCQISPREGFSYTRQVPGRLPTAAFGHHYCRQGKLADLAVKLMVKLKDFFMSFCPCKDLTYIHGRQMVVNKSGLTISVFVHLSYSYNLWVLYVSQIFIRQAAIPFANAILQPTA